MKEIVTRERKGILKVGTLKKNASLEWAFKIVSYFTKIVRKKLAHKKEKNIHLREWISLKRKYQEKVEKVEGYLKDAI